MAVLQSKVEKHPNNLQKGNDVLGTGATLSYSPLPQGEFSAGPAFHSCFSYSTYKPTYFILLILERRRKGEREREKHPLVDSCTLAHQGSTHNLGIKPPPFGAQDDAPTNSAAPARASHCSYHLLLGILPLWCLLHEESSRV